MRPLTRLADKHVSNGHRDMCYGPRFTLDFLLNYMKAMATSMGTSKRYFQFLWCTAMTHDYLNYGHVGEPFILSYFKWLKEEEFFNNTVLVLMSDHGIRWEEMQ